MKKNNAWQRKRQAKRNNRLKAKHRIKKQDRSMNNLNDYDVDDSSLYGWDDDSPFYPKDAIGDKPVLKAFYKVESNGSRHRANEKSANFLKRLLAGKTVSKSEMIYLRR